MGLVSGTPLLVVVTAAGRSRRMGGGNKLLLPLAGMPVLVHTVRAFRSFPRVGSVVVTAPPGEEEEYRRLIGAHGLAEDLTVVAGGSERQESIFRALQVLQAGAEQPVAIHDGARPLVSHPLLGRLLQSLEGWDGVLAAVPVKDTVKRVDGRGRVLETLPRSELYAAQTPQVFPYRVIFEAHSRAAREGHLATDDAALVEWMGGRVRVVEGDYHNLKITTAEDLAIAEALMEGG